MIGVGSVGLIGGAAHEQVMGFVMIDRPEQRGGALLLGGQCRGCTAEAGTCRAWEERGLGRCCVRCGADPAGAHRLGNPVPRGPGRPW